MISVDTALERVNARISARSATTRRPVKEALGQVLAEDVVARQDVPRFDNSAMDGYVLRRSDLTDGRGTFPIAFEIRPEDENPPAVPEGACARIMTGARIPEGGDLVVPVELTRDADGRVEILGVPDRNPIRPRGEGYAEGKEVLPKGTVIRPYEVGLLIESGNAECTVRGPLRVALQVTGSEIDEENDLNGPVLSRLMNSWPGVEVTTWPVLGDDPDAVEERLQELKGAADVIVTTGGISAGKHDYLFQATKRLGATNLIRKVRQKPGKPFTLSLWDKTPVCHLPGNPVSAVFTAECYARWVVARMLGLRVKTVYAATETALENHRTKTLFVTARLHEEDGRLWVQAEDRMRSHLLQLYRGQNAYARLEPESRYAPGDRVECIPFSTEDWYEGEVSGADAHEAVPLIPSWATCFQRCSALPILVL